MIDISNIMMPMNVSILIAGIVIAMNIKLINSSPIFILYHHHSDKYYYCY